MVVALYLVCSISSTRLGRYLPIALDPSRYDKEGHSFLTVPAQVMRDCTALLTHTAGIPNQQCDQKTLP